jgi:hypothetical protein
MSHIHADKSPRDDKGRFVSRECPRLNCGGGQLQYEGDGIWSCDGLAAPERDDQELECCDYSHIDGDPHE